MKRVTDCEGAVKYSLKSSSHLSKFRRKLPYLRGKQLVYGLRRGWLVL